MRITLVALSLFVVVGANAEQWPGVSSRAHLTSYFG